MVSAVLDSRDHDVRHDTRHDASPVSSTTAANASAPVRRGGSLLSHPGLVAAIADVAIIITTMALAYLIRFDVALFAASADAPTSGSVIGALWVVVLIVFGTYFSKNLGAGTLEYHRILLASITTAGLVGIGCYLTQNELSRDFFVLVFTIGTPALMLGRWTMRRVMHRMRRAGRLRVRVLVAGRGDRIDEIARVLDRESWLGYEIVGALTPEPDPSSTTESGVPVVGHTGSTLAAVRAHEVDAVIFADGSFATSDDFRRMAWDLEDNNAQMIVVPGLTDVSARRVAVRPVAGLPLVHIERPQSQNATRTAKRVFDIVGASLLLLLAAPVMLAVSLSIWFEDRAPVLFRQTRVGRQGSTFSCLKFRSMVTDAEARLAELEAKNEGGGLLFKMAHDPRITRTGRFIRRFSLDELPQLWNVIRGEMSLVGPRPPLPKEVAQYEFDVLRRLAVRPGLTGLWQVSGRSDLPWDETVRLDLYYVDNWSMMQDLSILMKTVGAVVASRGAY